MPTLATNFLNVQFNQAQLPCRHDSYILIYFIFFQAQSKLMQHKRNLRECSLKDMSRLFLNLAQTMHVAKWVGDTCNT